MVKRMAAVLAACVLLGGCAAGGGEESTVQTAVTTAQTIAVTTAQTAAVTTAQTTAQTTTAQTTATTDEPTQTGERLCVSIFKDGKSSIWEYDTVAGTWTERLSKRHVMLSSCMDGAGNLFFIDALSDYDQWQVFRYDAATKKVSQLTDDMLAKGDVTMARDGEVYFNQSSSVGMNRVFRLDKKGSGYVPVQMQDASADTEIPRYCVGDDDAIYTAEYSFSEANKLYENSEDGNYVQDVSIVCYDKAHPNGKTVTVVQTSFSDVSELSVAGKNLLVVSEDEKGAYRFQIVDLTSDKITATYTAHKLCASKGLQYIGGLGCECCLSENGDAVYFAGVPDGATTIDLDGIEGLSMGLFRLDLKTGKVTRLDTFKDAIVSDITEVID
ncbi:MAG: hypothetical protein QM689_11845 [Oscillospiraceae bacterium]